MTRCVNGCHERAVNKDRATITHVPQLHGVTAPRDPTKFAAFQAWLNESSRECEVA